VVTPDGQECTSREAIEAACLKENQVCFDQAKNTPFLEEPLFLLIGSMGEGPGVKSILDGTVDIPGLSLELSKILKALHSCCTPQDQPFPPFTAESYQAIWLQACKQTSSCAHYNLHFGHYMATCADPELTTLNVHLIDITL